MHIHLAYYVTSYQLFCSSGFLHHCWVRIIVASLSGFETDLSSGPSVTSLQVILNENFHLLSPSSSWQAGRVYFSPSPIVGIISRSRLRFHTAVSQSRFLSVTIVRLTWNQKGPKKTTALMPKAMKKAFRATSGVSRVVRVWSEVSASRSVPVSSAWMGLCPSVILMQTCTFRAAWKWNALCRLHYAQSPPPHPFPDQLQTADTAAYILASRERLQRPQGKLIIAWVIFFFFFCQT